MCGCLGPPPHPSHPPPQTPPCHTPLAGALTKAWHQIRPLLLLRYPPWGRVHSWNAAELKLLHPPCAGAQPAQHSPQPWAPLQRCWLVIRPLVWGAHLLDNHRQLQTSPTGGGLVQQARQAAANQRHSGDAARARSGEGRRRVGGRAPHLSVLPASRPHASLPSDAHRSRWGSSSRMRIRRSSGSWGSAILLPAGASAIARRWTREGSGKEEAGF